MAGSGSAEKGKSRFSVCLKTAATGILAAGLLACAGCAEINDSIVRYRLLDHTQKRQILPVFMDGYEKKMHEPRPVTPPTRLAPEVLDQG